MNEKLLEKKLREDVKKLGGLALKFSSSTYTGMPDRIVLMPGHVYFVELKSTGKTQTPVQKRVVKILNGLEQDFWLIDSEEGLQFFLCYIWAKTKVRNRLKEETK